MTRIEGTKNSKPLNEIASYKLFESIRKQNITNNSFFIQKAEIEISGREGNEKFLASIKFKNPDKYLISLKGKTGIEAARIFLSDDTLLVNDRINRKQYCGTPEYLKIKYGITASVLPVIFGDYIDDNMINKSNAECSNGKLDIDCIINGIKIKYVIDCIKGKCISEIIENGLNSKRMEIQFTDFFKKEKNLIPGKIEILDLQRETTIKIRIKKVVSPWEGNIEFIPGNKYEIIQLL